MTEATHFSQCVHDQQRRLEAEDCDSIRCAQLISGGRRRIRPPCSASLTLAHNALHSPSILTFVTQDSDHGYRPTTTLDLNFIMEYDSMM